MTKAVLITGAGSGIGKATALAFAAAGYFVYLLGRDKSKLEAVAELCRSGARRYSCDLQSEAQILKAIQDILGQRDTHLQALVNNAGIFERKSFEDEGLDSWRRQFETNLFGSVFITQCLLPHFKKTAGSSITNVASTLGLKPMAQTSAYSSSKAAMISWTQSLALELAPFQVRVNCVCPGLVETPIHGNTDMKQLSHLQPLGRVGQPMDIAHSIEFLASEKAAWTTGSILNVDGGINLL